MRRFAYTLCLELGVSHPDNLPLTFQQFMGWHAYYQIAPFGELRRDLRAAQFVQTQLAKPKDLMKLTIKHMIDEVLEDPLQSMTTEEMAAELEALRAEDRLQAHGR